MFLCVSEDTIITCWPPHLTLLSLMFKRLNYCEQFSFWKCIPIIIRVVRFNIFKVISFSTEQIIISHYLHDKSRHFICCIFILKSRNITYCSRLQLWQNKLWLCQCLVITIYLFTWQYLMDKNSIPTNKWTRLCQCPMETIYLFIWQYPMDKNSIPTNRLDYIIATRQ